MSDAPYAAGAAWPLAPHMQVAPPGPLSREFAKRLAAVECPAFDLRRQQRAELSGADQSAIVYARGQGALIECVDGNRYVDMVAGFGALCLGYSDPELTRALADQLGTLELALGDVYGSDIKLRAQERIAKLVGAGSKVMLGSSGADAVTAAMKTVHLATNKPGLIAFEGGYHGLTHGPLAALGLAPKFRAPFAAALSPHVTFVAYPRTSGPHTQPREQLNRVLIEVETRLRSGTIGGVLVEPILGRGGCVVPPAEFLPELRALCTKYATQLIVDEIWTACGRSGRLLWSADAAPDVVCLGKALGGGAAVSACVGTEEVMHAWGKHGGSAIHTATHFGSPIAAAAVVATLAAIDSRGLVEKAAQDGNWFAAHLREAGFTVSGAGFMIGIELASAAQALATCSHLLRRGYIALTGGSAGNVLTLTPALTIAREQLAGFAAALIEIRDAGVPAT